MSYLNKEKQQQFLEVLKKDYTTTFKELSFGGLVPIFFVDCENTSWLEGAWDRITALIATNFQTNLEAEFSTWNIYIFFIVNTEIPNALKYKIENDTFSSRKIIVRKGLSEDEIISSHIVNKLEYSPNDQTGSSHSNFESDPVIENALKEKKMTGKRQVTDESRSTLDEIISDLKDQKNEVQKG
jgi:hypothetical protein